MGRVVEEGHKEALSSNRSCNDEESVPDMSADELLTKLVRGSPRAKVILAGVPVQCVLDTGAETSLMSSSFYQKYLADKLSGLKPLGTYLEVYGVGGLEVPISGYIQVPLTVFHKTVDAHFLVVKDSCSDGLLSRKQSPLLLGCNILEMLKDVIVEQGQLDTEAWEVTLRWYRLTRDIPHQDVQGAQITEKVPLAARTGRHEISIPPRQVMTLRCNVRAPAHVLRNKVVIVEGIQSLLQTEGANNLRAAARVYDSCEVSNRRTVKVLVANLGTQSLEIPPFTKLASIIEASSTDCIRLDRSPDSIKVSINHVLVENMGDKLSKGDSGAG